MATTTINATAKRLSKSANKQANSTARNLHDMAEHTGENVRQFIDQKTQQLDELKENAAEAISEHPLKSIAFAALGGLVLGAILRRI